MNGLHAREEMKCKRVIIQPTELLVGGVKLAKLGSCKQPSEGGNIPLNPRSLHKTVEENARDPCGDPHSLQLHVNSPIDHSKCLPSGRDLGGKPVE